MKLKTKIDNSTLSVRGITKSFGKNNVLKGIDVDLYAGEIIALIGGNGAGKSTLMKIVMGIYQPDDGDIYINGKKTKISKPSVSLEHGIYLVPQEPLLFPNMSVFENIVMGVNGNRALLKNKLNDILKKLNWNLELQRRALTLSIAEQQLVEILRGLIRDSQILILDEPTSSLTFVEVQSLFSALNELKIKGISIIYITHRLAEVFEIANKVLIMRDGIITLQGPCENFTRDMLVQGLLPQDTELNCSIVSEKVNETNYNKEVLKIKNLCGYGFNNISFTVHEGEILGLAGVVGAGRTELATSIYGMDSIKSGKIYLNGEDISGLKTKELIEKGVAYVVEDRFLNGIFSKGDINLNTTATYLSHMGKFFIDHSLENNTTNNYVELFRTKITGNDQKMASLSGGNQQKVVIARALAIHPKLLILDEPTRGIDAAARADVYCIIQQLKQKGLAILLISSDIEEIIELSDRALSMYCGNINKEFKTGEITQDNLMAAAFGVGRERN